MKKNNKFQDIVTGLVQKYGNGLSDRQLADKAGLANNYVSRLKDEHECPDNPGKENLAKLSKALNLEKNRLFNEWLACKSDDKGLAEVIKIYSSGNEQSKKALLKQALKIRDTEEK